jgi:hypothetical protein
VKHISDVHCNRKKTEQKKAREKSHQDRRLSIIVSQNSHQRLPLLLVMSHYGLLTLPKADGVAREESCRQGGIRWVR